MMGREPDTDAAVHLNALDGMRAIAIGGVLLLHLDRAHFPGEHSESTSSSCSPPT